MCGAAGCAGESRPPLAGCCCCWRRWLARVVRCGVGAAAVAAAAAGPGVASSGEKEVTSWNQPAPHAQPNVARKHVAVRPKR